LAVLSREGGVTGDRDLDTFKAFVLADLTESVLVHDRYHLYDSAELGALDPSAVPPTPLP
jgi:hypothetical protein